ncbi:28564_t:CDS:2 [Dentiscutata erythropus]|uniref:28564_t:CDS:1 n=1 Tax=Dentiscutata erythropus TaxID=1348616 RepID=A0A9N9NE14_9GLOM|nr:28564_t:CDS:2 [Dentiscutata erythropus]
MCIAWISKLSKIFKKKPQKISDFAGANFVWPPTMNVHEYGLVFDYIIDPEWNPYITYSWKYGNEISSEEYEKLMKEYPGCFYIPIVEYPVVICKFTINYDHTRKERQEGWQLHTTYSVEYGNGVKIIKVSRSWSGLYAYMMGPIGQTGL